ncbi:EamA-like transporter family protein [Pseudodesulfovibrio hydrargyri]|uniref:EamA-like transporter family protein n=1 Tax=Pseudodesulfovibrio hydrargyri TaxID=2125990 RepID=A0A1J5NBD3_9BACT|nr:EamA family transporter RarD [Pseudodesulfovibrio hydrargyri]OIQ52128.1 EamA-like transporter family protein [Pseudodesulfovibrio hydrargyri]
MPPIDPKQKTYGFAAALAAFFGWGLLPVYWKALITVNPFEILCHRVVWSLIFIAIILTLRRGWRETLVPLRSRRDLLILTASSLMIGFNWLLYIWAVNNDHVLDTSLGYYINPLVNVLLGFVFLRERLRPLQMIAIGLAALGVVNSVVAQGQLPWISLALAISFGLYGLLRKIASVESLPGLFLETMVLGPFALGYILWLQAHGASALFHQGLDVDLLLVGAGVATASPLIGFAYGARRLQLTTLGLLQYLAPSIAFLLGVFVYREPFNASHLLTFALIWSGLAVYTAESVMTMRAQRRLAGARPAA